MVSIVHGEITGRISSMNIIAKMWLYSEACSKEPEVLPDYLDGKKCIYIPMKNKLDYGYIAEYEDKIVICYRGTGKKIAAWISDFDAYPLQEHGMIHDGFYEAWSAFKPVIDAYIKASFKINGNDFSSVNKPVFITGHSRGGNVGTLCARHLAKNRNLKCILVSFGTPAQGKQNYVDQLNSLPINHTRVVNDKDIVPLMPPYHLGFRHGGNLVKIGETNEDKFELFERIKDHYYSSYTKSLIEYSKSKSDNEAVDILNEILPFVEI
jgi:hypothetical protein